jgi:hypothetical protein
MATLEDTFRMMKGENPVNKNRLSEFDQKKNEIKQTFINDFSGSPAGKTTRDFMESVRGTLIESRGGTRPQPKNIEAQQEDLVNTGKVLVALLGSIKPNRLDERVLLNVSQDMKRLTEHLSTYPEFQEIIKRRIK